MKLGLSFGVPGRLVGRHASARIRRWLRNLVLVFGALLLARAEAAVLKEYEIKAGFIYNFAISTEWPARAFPDRSAPMIFGILGEDPSNGAFEALRGVQVKNRELVVRKCRDVSEALSCQVLFINPSEKRDLARILDELKNASILTVTEADVALASRGIVHFVIDRSRVRFEVDVTAAERVGLKISSQVLKVARVRREEPKNRQD